MSDTTHLGLPFIDAAQSQKHVTHNEALSILDACIQLSVSARNVAVAPASPSEGARWLVGASPSGAFAGKSGDIAVWQDNAWRFLTPRAGWRTYVESEGALLVFDGSAWSAVTPDLSNLQNVRAFGLNTTADATNPIAVKANAALFTARTLAEDGSGDLRFKLNKEAAAKTISQLYQSNYSGRAETGLIGDDHFRIKVSADGSVWLNAIDIDPSTGVVAFPSGVSGISASGGSSANRIINGNFLINQRNFVSGSSLSSAAYGHDRWRAGSGGCSYSFTQLDGDTTISITVGTLQQAIEAANVEAGTYTLSWIGTAQGRINGGSYVNSPITATLSAGSQTVEFNAGSLACVALAKGSSAASFEHRSSMIELAMCQRYYYRRSSSSSADIVGMMSAWASNSVWGKLFDLPVEMRVAPSVSLSSSAHLSVWNASGSTPYVGSSVSGITSSKRSVGVFGGFSVAGTPSFAAGQALFMTFNTTSGWIAADAEL